jgi:hypothetical protein
MLHIKLPKGGVSDACERAAYNLSHREAERESLFNERERFRNLANMATYSTGDVYVSPELWEKIKAVYY